MNKYQEALNNLRNVSYDDYHSCMLEETHGDKLDIIEKALKERDIYFKALCDIESGENVRKVLERTLTQGDRK